MWFKTLTGFSEESPEQVRENMTSDGIILKSRVNGRELIAGTLETPTLAELREKVLSSEIKTGKLSVREEIADVQQLHVDKLNAGALFQVASQFNLLEMISPDVSPEQGVDGYEYDKTQGPACAVAAGAGTIYRNYFSNVNGQVGQSANNQIDCLSDIGNFLGNENDCFWSMRNGYALATESGLLNISEKIKASSESEIDDLRKLLRIGIQWDTEVTIGESRHTVTQAYCSALPVAYSQLSSELWSDFSKLVLEASYEATIIVGILNYLRTGRNKVYLTLIGGGAFGNEIDWILSSIQRSVKLYKHVSLDVVIVSYGCSNSHIQELIRNFENTV